MAPDAAHFRLFGIAGSLRTGSYNLALLRAAGEVLPAGFSLEIGRIDDIPLYNADVQSQGDPASVARLKKQIDDADAFLIATPEYNYSIPGVLKNALDWASRPPKTCCLRRKPIGIMGCSSGDSGTMQRTARPATDVRLHRFVRHAPAGVARAQGRGALRRGRQARGRRSARAAGPLTSSRWWTGRRWWAAARQSRPGGARRQPALAAGCGRAVSPAGAGCRRPPDADDLLAPREHGQGQRGPEQDTTLSASTFGARGCPRAGTGTGRCSGTPSWPCRTCWPAGRCACCSRIWAPPR